MLKNRILFLLTTIALPIISSAKDDQLPESNRNINLYLAPPPGHQPLAPEARRTVYLEPQPQNPKPIPVYGGYEVKSHQPEDEKITINILKGEPKPTVSQSNYNNNNVYESISYGQHQPKLEFRSPDEPNTKYALEPEGPDHTKVTVNVIKEHKKTYAVDPSYLENRPDSDVEYQKPQVVYKTVESEYPTAEVIYKKLEPEYTKYELKHDEPQEKKVIVLQQADSEHKQERAYYEPEYKTLETVYRNSEPQYNTPEAKYKTYEIKEREPRDQDVVLKVVKEDNNSFEENHRYEERNVNPEYTKNVKTITEYRKPEPKYIKYEIRKNEPKELVKVIEKDEKPFSVDSQYKSYTSYEKPVYKKSVDEYEKSEPEYRSLDSDYSRHPNSERHQEKTVIEKVFKEDKRDSVVEHRNDNAYLRPAYKKPLTEYRQPESDYDKYEDNEEDHKEKKVFVKVERDNKNTFGVDLRHKSSDSNFQPEYKKSVTRYEESEPKYMQESHYDKYHDEEREEKVHVKVVKKDKKIYVEDSKYKSGNTYDNAYLEPQYKKSVSEYENSERDFKGSEADRYEYEMNKKKVEEENVSDGDSKYENDHRYAESEYSKSESGDKQSLPDDDKYNDHHEEDTDKVVKDDRDRLNTDSKYRGDNTNFDSNNREYETEYKESESKVNGDGKFEKQKHDVLIKIWSKKSR